MKYKTASWKQKVAPAFDKIIKQYIQILNHTGLPADNGWVKGIS